MGFSGIDQKLKCDDCGHSFDFLVRDQEYFTKQGWTTAPKRCRPCRTAKKKRVDEAQQRRALAGTSDANRRRDGMSQGRDDFSRVWKEKP